MITLQEMKEFWSSPDGSVTQHDTFEMIYRLRKKGFAVDVPEDAADFMTEWANAEPGYESAFFAHKTIAALGLKPEDREVSP